MARQEFVDEIHHLQRRALSSYKQLPNEEAVKISLILPFLSKLGYNLQQYGVIVPEYKLPNRERIDFAIYNKKRTDIEIVIECKHHDEDIDRGKWKAQLAGYFNNTSAGIGILTNGLRYAFYNTADDGKTMNESPLFEFNLLDFSETSVNILEMFSRDIFNLEEIEAEIENMSVKSKVFETLDSIFTTKPFVLTYYLIGLLKDNGVVGYTEQDLFPCITEYLDRIPKEATFGSTIGAIVSFLPDNAEAEDSQVVS